MAFYRQLLVFTVPSVAVLFGLYWYRRRRNFGTSDPGGNIRNTKSLKQELEEIVEQAKLNQNQHCSSPARIVAKSAPIDIVPNGVNSQRSSPIHLTDKELDIEIDKVISQKNVEMELLNKKNSKENTPPAGDKRPKSLPAESLTTSSIKSQQTKSKVTNSVRHEPIMSCLTDQLLNCKINGENKDVTNRLTNNNNNTKLTISSVSPLKETINEEMKLEKSHAESLTKSPCNENETNNISNSPLTVDCVKTDDNIIKTDVKTNKTKSSNENNKVSNTSKSEKSSGKNKKSRKNGIDKKTDKKQSSVMDRKQNSNESNQNTVTDTEIVKHTEHADVRTDTNLIIESTEIDVTNNRDSANHSPSDVMLASPSIGHFSDNHSEGSNDSGKGCSESPSPPPSAGDVNQSSSFTCHQFLISKTTTGCLIGAKHSFIMKLNTATNAKVYIKEHPELTKFNVCVIEGIQQDIDIILDMIKQKLPEKKYHVSFKDVSADLCKSDYSSLADCYNLNLVEGVNNDVIISCYLNPIHLFLQQPMHPTYPSLHILHTLMGLCYQDPKVPKLPSPVTEGMICAAPTANNWYRTQVIMTNSENDSSLVKLVDFGGFMEINNSYLKQIRQDFMMLPFQATEVQLAHVAPVNGEWAPDAVQVIAGLTSGQMLQAQVVGYNDDGLPQVYIYLTLGPQQVISLNKELVVRGLAEWTEQEI